MVRCDKQGIPVCLACRINITNGLVSRLNTLDGCIQDTSVTHHIWRCKIAHHELILATCNRLCHVLGDARRIHFGLQVVRGNLGGGHHRTLLILKLSLCASVEEERHVRILLSLSTVVLLEPLFGDPLGQAVAHHLRRVHLREGEGPLVLSERVHLHFAGLGGLEGRLETDSLCELAHAIRAVVEAEQHLSVLDAALRVARKRLDELVRLRGFKLVPLLHLCHGVCNHLAFVLIAAHHVEGCLHTLPSLVTIHRPVASHHRGYLAVAQLFHLLDQLLKVPRSTLWGCITTVHDAVHKRLRHTDLLCSGQNLIQMFLVGVHSAV
mmetsp:Transcript_30498/g.58722  ORF Transcript_30498/g.58722 Transcript_30498/m.58722 type:complete len:323 (-) Transcript_30498:425-1393(-)